MKYLFIVMLSLSLLFLIACDRTAQDTPSNKDKTDLQTSRPANVLLIITDDQGYGDLGHHGNDVIETPTLDELFEQGVSFDRFYVSPVCAPTRASLLTGKHYLSTGVFHVTRGGEKMHADNQTLAEMLKEQGFRTGLFGKWHNGLQYPHDPIGQGFEEFYGFSAGHLSEYYDNYLHHNGERVKYEGYVADVITDKSIAFVQQKSEQPFFAMLSFNTPHGPFQVPDNYFQKYKAKGLEDVNASIYGMVENIDDNIKRVLDALAAQGNLDNTIVLFMSDNGPAFPDGQSRYNAGLKGHKGLVDEGGVRSPLVIHWPDAKMQSHKVIPITQHIDMVPTLLSLLGIGFDKSQFDGRDLSPLIKQEDVEWQSRALYSHRFRIYKDASKNPIELTPAALRTQQFLAMAGEDGIWHLYDLENDPGQTKDIANEQPELLHDFKEKYKTWFERVTSEHGTYTFLPIEVGHSAQKVVGLPAHEAIILEGLDYQHGMGWSHDWLIASGKSKGKAYWPVKLVSSGRYKIEIDYASESEDFDGEISVKIGSTELVKTKVEPYKPTQLSTSRQYYTNEAPDMTWATLEMGEVELESGELPLEVFFSQDANGRNLWLKEARLIQL